MIYSPLLGSFLPTRAGYRRGFTFIFLSTELTKCSIIQTQTQRHHRLLPRYCIIRALCCHTFS